LHFGQLTAYSNILTIDATIMCWFLYMHVGLKKKEHYYNKILPMAEKNEYILLHSLSLYSKS